MKLVVTGTRHGRPDVAHWLSLFVGRRGLPDQFILGDSYNWCGKPGVDGQARAWVLSFGYADRTIIEDARRDLPSPERFHERNRRMAVHVGPGDWVLAFPDDDSRGTWQTLELCKARGALAAICPLRGAK